ncbi:glycoside hydrolase family 13 protein [Athelia psychrophila]|uniref:Alpha-amylase n=1 Tax=Athelia psychrophila TaxID=1759441 RepID=A0A166Q6M7_9AGAM|nr:glycoside hydrolase family 13 protein [Fibularhizoctonia sp. CBS 109695]
MFEWDWNSVATECTQFIGPAGYGYVQVSPPSEHITGSQWWTDYQVVSYELTSKRGTPDEFDTMVSTCSKAGVSVIADVVLNHMTAGSGTGVGGNAYTQYSYPAVPYTQSDFHAVCSLDDYNNSTNVWNCQLDGLADLATESSNVQTKETAYANNLISKGVKGFRLDSAKSMDPANIKAVLSGVSSEVYVTQEVVYGGAVDPSEYTGNGDVMEFRFASALQSAFLGSGISSLENLNNQGWVASSSANVFVADHDTERSSSSLNYSCPDNTYTNAHVFMLGYDYGTPTVLSGYKFSGYDDGAPNNGTGTCTGNTGTGGWICQHRWTPVIGMVGFHNNAGTKNVTDWFSPNSELIAFGRGSSGFVAINNQNTDWDSASFSTSMDAGSYCDVTTGNMTSNACTGTKVTVTSGGAITITVPSYGAIAIHSGAMLS